MTAPLAFLDETHVCFPPVSNALVNPDGLLAIGGNLKKSTLLKAYTHGIFPWFNEGEAIQWWSPDPRMVLFPDKIEISRSLSKVLRKKQFTVSTDQAFPQVIHACSEPRKAVEGTWITHAMQEAYTQLFRSGFAHSVEIWQDGILAGGLYGVAIGRIFFGESMFSRKNNASKVALVWLCQQIQQRNFALIDCQVYSNHLHSMGASMISRHEFIHQLEIHCRQDLSVANWL
ncbi:Leucyl/phenylalanyl-tRNA--protein transferase [invertebrate metagenome]|uniref:Leucyl/phenylalanyl-tRNA--protein transferase n=1 Tax=invertebrate metagenome TaxID=1711999 RepID=A0A2H9T7T2_9ZZZZ